MNKGLHDGCFCKRWAFSLQKNLENEKFGDKYRRAIQCITPDDYEKVRAYRHKDDTLAVLAGRLFIRQAVKQFTDEDWAGIEFMRTEKGKPYLVKPQCCPSFGINVSHQGDYTVFAGSCTNKVGIDVMRLDMCRGNKTADEYITSMAKSASADELRNMRGQPTDQMKMSIFYRYWCLKEAILKATGQGIVDDLSRYDFRIDTGDRYKNGAFITSTYVLVDGKKDDQWLFEESFVDHTHVAAVCREKNIPVTCKYYEDPEKRNFFSKVDFDFLLNGATTLNPLPNDGLDELNKFLEKPKKRF